MAPPCTVLQLGSSFGNFVVWKTFSKQYNQHSEQSYLLNCFWGWYTVIVSRIFVWEVDLWELLKGRVILDMIKRNARSSIGQRCHGEEIIKQLYSLLSANKLLPGSKLVRNLSAFIFLWWLKLGSVFILHSYKPQRWQQVNRSQFINMETKRKLVSHFSMHHQFLSKYT